MISGASLVAQMVKRLPEMRETWVRSLGWEDLLEEEMAIHSSILAWRIPWMEEPERLYSPWGHKKSDTTEWLHFAFTLMTLLVKSQMKVSLFLILCVCVCLRERERESPCTSSYRSKLMQRSSNRDRLYMDNHQLKKNYLRRRKNNTIYSLDFI